MIKYQKSNIGLTIFDSYKIDSDKEMESILNEIRSEEKIQTDILMNRSNKSLIEEWKSHNILYKMCIFRSHTADVDFEYPQKWYYKVGYKILSFVFDINSVLFQW